jgi:hypothetical protein
VDTGNWHQVVVALEDLSPGLRFWYAQDGRPMSYVDHPNGSMPSGMMQIFSRGTSGTDIYFDEVVLLNGVVDDQWVADDHNSGNGLFL